MVTRHVLYSAAECPACPGYGPILVLISAESSRPVFYCPACSTAWASLPSPPGHLNEVNSINEIAPGGVRLPSKEEIDRLGLTIVEAVRYEDWSNDLDTILKRK